MKGLFIPDITVEMFRNGCLESIETLMAEGEIYDIEYDLKSAPTELSNNSPKLDNMKELKPHWIPCSERLPEELVPVNITWVNHEPESYYEDIKDKPFSATGIYYRSKWWWYSATAEDVLAEHGRSEFDRVSDSVEIIAWQPLPSPYREEQ